jgi:hypothetical protein
METLKPPERGRVVLEIILKRALSGASGMLVEVSEAAVYQGIMPT